MFEEMTEKFEPLKGKRRTFLTKDEKGRGIFLTKDEKGRWIVHLTGFEYVDVKSAVQGLLEALEKKKKKLKEDLSVLKGFMSFRQRRDFILILEWIDWFEQEIKKWFADVIEDEK